MKNMRKYAFNEIPNLALSGLSFPNWGTKKGCHFRNSLWFEFQSISEFLTGEVGCFAKFFLNTNKLIVFCHPVGT